jgi:hypothetical protein
MLYQLSYLTSTQLREAPTNEAASIWVTLMIIYRPPVEKRPSIFQEELFLTRKNLPKQFNPRTLRCKRQLRCHRLIRRD